MKKQRVGPRGINRLDDPIHGHRLISGEFRWRVGIRSRAKPVEPAGICTFGRQRDLAVGGHALERGHGGTRRTYKIGCLQFPACAHQLGEHGCTTAIGSLGTGYRTGHQSFAPLPGGRTERPRAVWAAPERPLCAGWQHQLEA